MSTKFKYVVVENKGLESPIIFPEWITHKEIARGQKVVSAGFLSIIATPKVLDDTIFSSNDIQFECSGGSVSLDVQSRHDVDSKLLRDYWKRTLN